MTGWTVNNKLEKMWKDMIRAQFEVLAKHLPGELKDSTKTLAIITSLQNKVWTRVLHER